MLGETAKASVSVITSCVGCVSGLEKLKAESKDSAHLISFTSTLFIASGILLSRHAQERHPIPVSKCVLIAVLFYIVNALNNTSLTLQVPYPLFIVFKSGSLATNMVMGYVLRRRFYSVNQIVSVSLVTIGVILFTISCAGYAGGGASHQPEPSSNYSISYPVEISVQPYTIGVVLMAISLLLSAYLGIRQEEIYRTYGAENSQRLMLYVNWLSLPMYVLNWESIRSSWLQCSASPVVLLPLSSIAVPRAYLFIVGISVLQYVCLTSVFKLTSLTTSLNVTMLLTLRKFLSLFISVYFFENAFTSSHFVSTVLVFLGTFLFATNRSLSFQK